MSSGVLYCFSVLVVKLSLGLSFLRVLSIPSQRMAAWCLIIFSTIINLALGLFLLFSCGNPAHFANKVIGKKCQLNTVQFRVLLYIQACANIVVDLGLLALPLSIVMNSMMTARAKVSVSCIFVLACSYVQSPVYES